MGAPQAGTKSSPPPSRSGGGCLSAAKARGGGLGVYTQMMRPDAGLPVPPPLRSGHPAGCSRLPHFVVEAKIPLSWHSFFIGIDP